jgi:hypothetical protein
MKEHNEVQCPTAHSAYWLDATAHSAYWPNETKGPKPNAFAARLVARSTAYAAANASASARTMPPASKTPLHVLRESSLQRRW